MSKNILIASSIVIVIVLTAIVWFNYANRQKDTGGETASPQISASPEVAKEDGIVQEQGTLSEKQNEKPVAEEAFENAERFVVAIDKNTVDDVSADLFSSGFIKDREAFKKAFGAEEGEAVVSGGYKISKDMSAEQIVKVLRDKPYMKWIVIPEGLRKEEIAELLANTLGWTIAQKEKWINDYTAMKLDYIEGVYFPDTYLIPVDEDPLKVAERLQAKFNEKFAAYLPEFNSQNIKWTTGLTFASIVQREAANDSDMPLIAGILWNRLAQNMALNVDATLQYVRGDTGKGWWASISIADKKTESPYNTYLNKGLPPHPICNPGIPAIEATLNPAETDCIYYLHDADHVTHCSKTYEEHLDNIEKYLKNGEG
ncbi:MAG: endolytic transglycosylase MltG [Candidatus Paceibacterota bacterium]|jgi:UPF0755 protein